MVIKTWTKVEGVHAAAVVACLFAALAASSCAALSGADRFHERVEDAYASPEGLIISISTNSTSASVDGSGTAFRSDSPYLTPYHDDAANWGFLWYEYQPNIACAFYNNTGTVFRTNATGDTDRCGQLPGYGLVDATFPSADQPNVVITILDIDGGADPPNFDTGHRWNEIVLDRYHGVEEKALGPSVDTWPLATGGLPQANVFFMCESPSARFGDGFNSTRDIGMLSSRIESPLLRALPAFVYCYWLHDTSKVFDPTTGTYWETLTGLESYWANAPMPACNGTSDAR